MPIDLNAVTLVNYCHPDCQPMKNIVRLPKDEAFALAGQLAQAHPETTAFYRFADFINYYDLRVRQDAYLRRRFIALGGKPVEEHPLSFVLAKSDYLREWFGNGVVTRVYLKDIPAEAISFTMGDSGAVYQKTGGAEMLTKDELTKKMLAYPGELDAFLRELLQGRHYVEAQVWDDRYVCGEV